ncbi:hypothetical protein [Roseateles sp. L2-2]|uniref:hypothetical protein n=1 Tax=Roseateles sp. L2-2 TaxID=3422597 RepID=UPI003D36AD30
MNDALQLLVADYLELMKESGELDDFMPLLVSGMGHQVVHTAQKGVRENGVDMASVGKDDSGRRTLFMWVLKCGTIGRAEWNSGPQSIFQSLQDLAHTYVRANVAPEHSKLPRMAVVVTNGEFLSSIQGQMAGAYENYASQYGIKVVNVNGSKLAAWTVEHLLDDHILPIERRSLFRRMLANVGQPDLCISVGRQLVNGLVSDLPASGGSAASRKKRTLQALRGIRAALSALTLRAAEEDNLLAPYRLSEYAVLATWSKVHADLLNPASAYAVEFGQILGDAMSIAMRYHSRLDAFYRTENGFAYVLPHNLFLSKRVFEEAGRLGLQGCFWAWHASTTGSDAGGHWAYSARLVDLLSTHSNLQFPAFDHQATDIHLAMLLLVITGRNEVATGWMHSLCERIGVARTKRDFWPTVRTLDEQLQVRFGLQNPSDASTASSTLIPILLTWTAALGLDGAYQFLREVVMPECSWSTPNFWSSDAGYDEVVADPRALHSHGIGEALAFVPAKPKEFLERMAKPLPGVESIEASGWYRARFPFIPMLAALQWERQIPRQMLVQQAVAFCESGAALNNSPEAPAAASETEAPAHVEDHD